MGKITTGLEKVKESRYFCATCQKYHRTTEKTGFIISVKFEEYYEYMNFVDENGNNKAVSQDRNDTVFIKTCNQHKIFPEELNIRLEEGKLIDDITQLCALKLVS